MAGSTSNPRIWELGDVYTAVTGTARPATPTVALSGAWAALGLLSDTGAVGSRTQTTTDHYAWGNIKVRTTRSKYSETIKVTALEDNPTVFDLTNHGSFVYTNGSVSVRTVKTPTENIRAFLIETTDGANVRRRFIPTGEVVEVGDVTMSEDAMEMRELTISIYPDANRILYYDISNDSAVSSS